MADSKRFWVFLGLALAAGACVLLSDPNRAACPAEQETAAFCDGTDPSADPTALLLGVEFKAVPPGGVRVFSPVLLWVFYKFHRHAAPFAVFLFRPDAPRAPPPAGWIYPLQAGF